MLVRNLLEKQRGEEGIGEEEVSISNNNSNNNSSSSSISIGPPLWFEWGEVLHTIFYVLRKNKRKTTIRNHTICINTTYISLSLTYIHSLCLSGLGFSGLQSSVFLNHLHTISSPPFFSASLSSILFFHYFALHPPIHLFTNLQLHQMPFDSSLRLRFATRFCFELPSASRARLLSFSFPQLVLTTFRKAGMIGPLLKAQAVAFLTKVSSPPSCVLALCIV